MENLNELPQDILKAEKVKIWEHIALRPKTFELFNKIKEESNLPPHLKTQDAFMQELLAAYKFAVENAKEEEANADVYVEINEKK